MPYPNSRHQYTDRERSLLGQLVERNLDVIETKKNDSESSLKKARAWHNIGLVYNSQHGVSHRTPVQLKKCWENLKTRYKQHMQQSDPGREMTVYHPDFANCLVAWIKEGRKNHCASPEDIIEPEDNEKTREIAKKMYMEQPTPKTKKCLGKAIYEESSSEDMEEDDDDEEEEDVEEEESSNYDAKMSHTGEIVRIKARHFTDKEKLKLVFLVAKNADAIECKKCDSVSLRNKALTWQKVTREFNQTEKTQWDVRQLKKLWENTKARARKAMENLLQGSSGVIRSSEAEAIKVLDALSSPANQPSADHEMALVNLVRDSINNKVADSEEEDDPTTHSYYDDQNTVIKTEVSTTSVSLDPVIKTPLSNDVTSLQRTLYDYQMQTTEKESNMKMDKMKKEKFLLEQQHQLQMEILEKQRQLAQMQVDLWSHPQ